MPSSSCWAEATETLGVAPRPGCNRSCGNAAPARAGLVGVGPKAGNSNRGGSTPTTVWPTSFTTIVLVRMFPIAGIAPVPRPWLIEHHWMALSAVFPPSVEAPATCVPGSGATQQTREKRARPCQGFGVRRPPDRMKGSCGRRRRHSARNLLPGSRSRRTKWYPSTRRQSASWRTAPPVGRRPDMGAEAA